MLALSTAFLEGLARRAPTGVLPCARLGVSRHRHDERGDPELEEYLLGGGDMGVLFSSVLEVSFAVVLKGLRVARTCGQQSCSQDLND